MEKKEFDEMIAINKALGGKFDVVLSEVAAGLGMEKLMEDDFTEKDLVGYMKNLATRINSKFLANDKLDRRKIATDKVIKIFEDEINSNAYKITVKKFLGKPETIDSIIVSLLTKIKENIKNPMFFDELVKTIVKTSKDFKAIPYINDLKNYQWNDAYKNENELTEPDWGQIYSDIVDIYEKDYVLTEEAYEIAIKEWVEGTILAVKNKSFKDYEVDIKELRSNITTYFDGLPKLFNVYKDLHTTTLAFFTRNSLNGNGAVIDSSDKKCITLTSLQKCIEKNFKISPPNFTENNRLTITSNQLIPEQLGSKNGYSWLADLLPKSIEENSSLFRDDALRQIIDNDIDPENIKKRVKDAISLWFESVYASLGNLNQENIPQTHEIEKDIKKLFGSYVAISGDICSNTLDNMIKVFESNKWQSLNSLCQNMQDSVFATAPSYKLKEVLTLWWKHFDGNFKNIDASSMALACLPSSSKIKEIFERNTCSISKDSIIKNIESWKASMFNPFINAAASLSNFKDIEKTTFSGAKLKDEYWGYLFSEDERLNYFKDTICSAISDKNALTASELDAGWNKGIMSIDSNKFWEDILFKKYTENNDDIYVIESWEKEKALLLPSEKNFTPLLINILLKLPIRKKSKTPTVPKISDRTLDGYIEQLDKWNGTLLAQYQILGHLLQRYYHVFEVVSDTHSDVKRDFDLFLDKCNSDLKAVYDNSWLSGTLGSIAKVAVVGVAALTSEITVPLAALLAATGATFAGDLVSGTVEFFTHEPTKYSNNLQSVFTTATNMTENMYTFAEKISNNIQKVDDSVRKSHHILTELKIKNQSLTPEMQQLLEKIDSLTGSFYQELVKYMKTLEKEINKIKLSNLDWAFEGFILRDFIVENVTAGSDDILLSETFVKKLRAYNFCSDSDFVDTYIPFESWADDVERLRSNIEQFNPPLFK